MAAKKKTTTAKKSSKAQQHNYKYAVYAIGSLVAAYGFASLAIDSGSILVYTITTVCIYAAFRFGRAAFQKK